MNVISINQVIAAIKLYDIHSLSTGHALLTLGILLVFLEKVRREYVHSKRYGPDHSEIIATALAMILWLSMLFMSVFYRDLFWSFLYKLDYLLYAELAFYGILTWLMFWVAAFLPWPKHFRLHKLGKYESHFTTLLYMSTSILIGLGVWLFVSLQLPYLFCGALEFFNILFVNMLMALLVSCDIFSWNSGLKWDVEHHKIQRIVRFELIPRLICLFDLKNK